MSADILFKPNITPFRRGAVNFVFLDNARNVRRALTGSDSLSYAM